MTPLRTSRSRRALRRTAVGAGLTAAALALLPAAAAAADTTIQLTEDSTERFVDYVDDSAVTVAPGATLTVPAPPEGTEWETGIEFLLFDVSEFGDLSEVGDSGADSAEAPGGLEDVGEPPAPPALPEALPDDAGEVAALADEASDEPGVEVAGTIEPGADGGVQVVLDTDVPEGAYSGAFFATGEGLDVAYFVTLEIAEGGDTAANLDYSTAEVFIFDLYTTVAEIVLTPGERVTLVAPSGVDLGDFELEVFLPESEDLEFPFYLPEEVDAAYAEDGSSVSFVAPAVEPDQEDGSEPRPLPAGTALEVVLFETFDDEQQSSFADYLVTGLTVGADGGTATTRPPIPTAVPAGEGPVPGSGPGVAALAAGAVVGAAVVGAGGLLLRRRAGVGTHR
jgi:hypothetical protein